jgi:hypothetical protein
MSSNLPDCYGKPELANPNPANPLILEILIQTFFITLRRSYSLLYYLPKAYAYGYKYFTATQFRKLQSNHQEMKFRTPPDLSGRGSPLFYKNVKQSSRLLWQAGACQPKSCQSLNLGNPDLDIFHSAPPELFSILSFAISLRLWL